MPTLKDLLKELYSTVADKWEDIGIMLEIEEGLLNRVKADNPGDSSSCLREMLKIWLKVYPPQKKPSWSAIVEALKVLSEGSLAHQIGDKYCC